MTPARTEAMLKMYRNAGLGGVVQEASPHRLIHLLLEGAVSRIAVARGAMESGDMAQKGRLVGDVMGIVSALRASLNFEAGGDIAAALGSLYDYMLRRLLEASAANDAGKLDEVVALLGEIKSAWDAIPGARPGHDRHVAAGS